MITPDGWYDFALRIPGPPDKKYSAPNESTIYIPHSAVGYYAGWSARLFSDERLPNGRYTPYAAASVHGFVHYDGTVIQHYPLTVSCWASGSEYPNTHGAAFETEGGPPGNESEPLREEQIAAHTRLIKEWSEWKGWVIHRRPIDDNDTGADLYEHNECKRWGSDPTACPSNRIPWDDILARLRVPGAPYSLEQVLAGNVAAMHFFRNGWNMADLSQDDKNAIHYLSSLVP